MEKEDGFTSSILTGQLEGETQTSQQQPTLLALFNFPRPDRGMCKEVLLEPFTR